MPFIDQILNCITFSSNLIIYVLLAEIPLLFFAGWWGYTTGFSAGEISRIGKNKIHQTPEPKEPTL